METFVDFSRWLFRKDLRPTSSANFWMHLLSQFWYSFFFFLYHHLFSLSSPLSIWEGVFSRNGWRIWSTSYFQEKAPYQMFDSFLDVFLNSVVMLLYRQYYYSFLFIYFVILSFPCFITFALIAVSELLCVIIYHCFWRWDTLLLTLDNFYISLVFCLILL